jgi:SAM-dependent methyltransferase
MYGEQEAATYDLEHRWKRDDIPFWVEMAQEYAGHTGGSVLELAVGTGRLAVPLARAGFTVWGIDGSAPMLERAIRHIGTDDQLVRDRLVLRQEDMRGFRLERHFDLIFCGFNSFLLLTEVADQFAALHRVAEHLTPGGVLVLDLAFPDLAVLASDTDCWCNDIDEPEGSGGRLVRDHLRHVDRVRQRQEITFRVQRLRDRQLETTFVDQVLTYIFPRELQHLLARAGYTILHLWGDYGRMPLLSSMAPERLIVVARPDRSGAQLEPGAL